MPKPWRIVFYELPDGTAPALDFLAGLPRNAEAKLRAALAAIAAGPPPSFVAGRVWRAMHGEMAGIYEVRTSAQGQNLRLFCVLVRHPFRYGAPAIVCLGGLSKPLRSPARPSDYERIRRYADDFASGGPGG